MNAKALNVNAERGTLNIHKLYMPISSVQPEEYHLYPELSATPSIGGS